MSYQISRLYRSAKIRGKALNNAIKKPYAYTTPAWLNGSESFRFEEGTLSNVFRNLYQFEITASEREWKQMMFYSEIANLVEDVPGDIAEFGVSGGVSLMAFTRIFNCIESGLDNKEKRKIYGFDSFEGLPELSNNDSSINGSNAQMKEGGFKDELGASYLKKFVNEFQSVSLVKGWFSQTIPEFLECNPAISFSLVHVDCDLYESTMDVLEGVWDYVTPGGVIVFDELFHKDFPGETKAFREFFDSKNNQYSLKKSKIKPDKKYIIKL